MIRSAPAASHGINETRLRQRAVSHGSSMIAAWKVRAPNQVGFLRSGR